MNRPIALAVAFALSACAPVMRTQNVHAVSRNVANPGERRLVWARALDFFQTACMPIELSDPAGGLLVSKEINSELRCSVGRCQCHGSTQFTIAEDGTAMISRNCVVAAETYGGAIIQFGELDRFRKAQDHALLVIVGGAPPEGTPAAARGNAKRGEACAGDSDCAAGLVCPAGRCMQERR
jgi:hypothetical protein